MRWTIDTVIHHENSNKLPIESGFSDGYVVVPLTTGKLANSKTMHAS
jgi:hypothetical protein